MNEFLVRGPLLCIAAAVVSLGRSGGNAYNKKRSWLAKAWPLGVQTPPSYIFPSKHADILALKTAKSPRGGENNGTGSENVVALFLVVCNCVV